MEWIEKGKKTMPKIRGYTDEQKRKREAERIYLFIRRKSREKLKGLNGLAEAIGLNYQTLYAALHKGTVRASTMRDIINALDMTNEEVLYLMGRKK